MEPKPASESHAVLVKWMGMLDANTGGFVHGGAVMRLCDEAAGLSAVKYSRRRVVTAAIDRMTFLHPVHVGELLTFNAAVNAVWRTSMEVGVRVEAENPRTGEQRHTNSAYLTMVALDEEGRPAAVAPLIVQGAHGERRAREAQVRRSNRLAEREQMIAARGE